MKRKDFSEEEIKELVELYLSGVSLGYLANKYHTHKIKDILIENNIEIRSQKEVTTLSVQHRDKRIFLEDEINSIISLYNDGYSIASIGEKFKTSFIKKILIENNIQLRSKEEDKELQQEHSKQHFLEKYGVENPWQAEDVKLKCEQTKLERYGDSKYINREQQHQTNQEKYSQPYIFGSNYFKEKSKQTKQEKYGDPYYSNLEKTKQTNRDKYGVENVSQVKEFREKAKQTCVERFGVEYPIQLEEVLEKAKQTNLEKLGVEYPAQSKDCQEKAKQTKLEKYNDSNYTNREKAIQTNIEKYGVEYPIQLEEVFEKAKQTNREKYGCEYTFQSEEIRVKGEQTKLERYGDPYFTNPEKAKKTNKEKYGVEYPLQSNLIRKKIYRKYFYDDIYFDSSWELALWIYAKDHNEEIKKEPISILYCVNNKEHRYFPDFIYKGKLIEIKGDNQLNENGDLIDVYHNQDPEVVKYKNQCIKDNNVEIWTHKQIKFALDYIKETYGRTYLKQFKKY